MLQDKLPQLLQSTTNNFKIIVSSSYKAKQSLAAKGLTPAIFLHPFYLNRQQGLQQLSYVFNKDRNIKQLPQFVTIDIDDYLLLRKEEKNTIDDIDNDVLSKKTYQLLVDQKLKYMRQIQKSVFQDKTTIQKFINNQGYHWFQKANKMYLHGLTMGQDNYRVNTSDQPVGVCYIIQVQKQKSSKQIFQKIRNQTDLLVRKLFQLNSDQIPQIKPMLLILFDVSQGCTIQQALDYTQYFKNSTNIHSSLIYRLGINSDQVCDTNIWSKYDRPIFHYSYNIKPSDPIRIIAEDEIKKLGQVVGHHRETIRRHLQNRLSDLCQRYEEINKPTKIIANFFSRSTPNDKTYTKEQIQQRELADKLFVIQDYKKCYEIYKSLVSKMEKRNAAIQNNLSQMIQYCLAISKFQNLKLKSDPYTQIQKYSDRIIKYYQPKSKLRLKKYLIFLVYCFHTFRVFNRQFIRGLFYLNLKSSFSNASPIQNIIPVLLYEQFANMNLLYKNIDYRRYCYDMTRVATRFSEVKLYSYALRCFLIVQAMYRDTFANIEKYQAIQLSHFFIQSKNFRQSLKCLKSAWQIYVSRIQSQDLQKNEQQLPKIIQNYSKMIKQIQRVSPHSLQQIVAPNLQIPIILSLNLQTKDEMLQFDEKSGVKWQDIGQNILDSKQLMGAGLNQRDFRNLFRSFDYGTPQQKYMIHKFNSDSNMIAQAILKKNSRNAYVGQPLRVSFYMRNPIRGDIEVQQIKLKIKQKLQQYAISGQKNDVAIKSFKSEPISFTIIPKEVGYLEIQRIQWIFMKLFCEYRIKQPGQMISQQKNCYFKLNILPATGYLQCKAFYQDYYYQGQKTKIKLKFKNTGVQPINKIYLAPGEHQTFNNQKLIQIQIDLKPGQEITQQFDISIPIVHDSIQSGQEKCINKLLFLYKTGDKFRVSRTINKFNILRIAKIQNISCQRLSTHLHLLSFSKKKNNTGKQIHGQGLQWMIIPGGFSIVKSQAAELVSHTNYFFFIRKGDFSIAKFQFDSWAKDITSYPQQFFKLQNQDNNAINIRFLWRKQQKVGYISKTNIPILINQHAYLSKKFPINFKINYQKEATNNFAKNPFLQIPISIKLKNIIYDDELKITVNFIDGMQKDASWEGSTQRKFNLKLRQQAIINIKYIVVRPGIYILSDQIKYGIVNSKAQFDNISHSDYEKIYLTVKGQGDEYINSNANLNKKQQFDPFRQFTTISGAMSPRSTQIRIDNMESLI